VRSILSFDVDLICSRAALSGETFFLGAATRHGGQAMRRCYSGTFETNSITLIGDFVFGSIGFVAFICGKRMNLWKIMLCGLALMIFPLFHRRYRNLVR
jgi:hypothetical protein